jgi:hypothetical protein
MEPGAFREVQTVTSDNSLLADAKWNGSELLLLLADANSSSAKFYKFTYNLMDTDYTLVSGFPADLSLPGSAETITMDQDNTGKIWATFETGNKIYVIWTETSDHKTWNTSGYVLGQGTSSDDISAITVLPDGTIGVLWSDQGDRNFYFRTHKSGDPDTLWTGSETCNTGHSSDDHINIAVTEDGRLYAAVKTESATTHLLLERTVSGSWNTYTVSPNGGTRPGLMYNKEKDELLYYFQNSEGTSPVVLYRTPCSNIVLDSRTTILSSSSCRNVSGTKQILDAQSGCLILAQNGRSSVTSAHFYWMELEPGTVGNLGAASSDKNGAGIATYPNPFSMSVSIKCSMGNGEWGMGSVNYDIYDIKGRLIHSQLPNPKSQLGWNAQDQPAGTYIIKAQSGDQVLSKRIILNK